MKRALALAAALAVVLSGCFGTPVNAPPVVTARASATSVAVGDEVIFTGTAVDTDGSVVRFEWDFTSDGTADFVNASRGATTFRYALPGAYQATFRAFDNQGASASMAVNVTVVARFTFNADWGAQAGFLVHGAATLDAGRMIVTVTPFGAAAFTFRLGEGLAPVNNTSYRVSVPTTQLGLYSSIRVEATYNATPSGFRVFRPVPFFTAENDSSAVFEAEIHDTRVLAGGTTQLDAVGSLAVAAAGSVGVSKFSGTANTTFSAGVAPNLTTAAYSFSSLTWNHSVSTSTGAFHTVDYAWNGTGSQTVETESGYPTHIDYTTYRGTRYQGNLTSLELAGTGTFASPGTSTGGTINYTGAGANPYEVTDGQGATRLGLRVVERYEYNGTLGGAAYQETNVSETLRAASDAVENAALFVSWNTTGHVGATSLTGGGSRFIDSDGDGTFNPDPRPVLPFDGQHFAGLAPAELEVGDAFTLVNALGSTARVEASAPRSEVLSAGGFQVQAVDVMTIAGTVTGGGLSGAVLATVVVTGPHNLLRLRYQVTLSSPTGTFSEALTLAARGA